LSDNSGSTPNNSNTNNNNNNSALKRSDNISNTNNNNNNSSSNVIPSDFQGFEGGLLSADNTQIYYLCIIDVCSIASVDVGTSGRE
jgi:hypothetical protein